MKSSPPGPVTTLGMVFVTAASSLSAPVARAAAPSVVAPSEGAVEVVVDTSAIGPEFEDLDARVEGVVRVAAEVMRKTPDRVNVGIRWKDADAFAYEVEVTLEDIGSNSVPVVVRKICDGCTQSALVDACIVALREAAVAREEAQEITETAPPPAPTASRAFVSPADSPAHRPTQRQRVGPLGWAGVSLLATGVAASATGAALLAVRSRTTTRPHTQGSIEVTTINLVPAGGASLGLGLAAVVTGTALLVTDRVRARHLKVRVTGGFGAHFTAVALTGSF